MASRMLMRRYGVAAFERIVQHIEQSPHPNVLANITINTINHQNIATW